MTEPSYHFGEFELNLPRYELRRSGEPIRMERIPMELLILLVEQHGQLVSRDVIVQKLWGEGVFLETEHSINTAINKLRTALDDRHKAPVFIQTVIGKGYRFIAPIAFQGTTSQSQLTSLAPPESPSHKFAASPAAAPVVRASVLPMPAEPLTHNGRLPHDPSPGTSSAAALTQQPVPAPTGRLRQAALRSPWSIVGLAVALLLCLTVYVFWHRHHASAVAPGFHSIAVLPFRNLSPYPDKDYLADGLTDEITTLLARSSSLRVISRTSVMLYKGANKSVPSFAAALNVDAIVEGSLAISGDTVRIHALLLDARHDRYLWAQEYQQSGSDVPAIQDHIASDIALDVTQKLGGHAPRLREESINPAAREFYLRGRYLWHQRRLDSLQKSILYYKKAIAADPEYADAYVALGEAYVLLSSYGGPAPALSLREARAAAEKALQLDPSLGGAHTVLGAVKVDLDWDWQGAGMEYRQAIKLDPEDATAHHWYALHLARLRRFPEAQAEIQQALDLDPLSMTVQTDAAEISYYARKPAQAQAQVMRALDLDKNFAEAHLVLGKVYEEQGQFGKAEEEFRRAIDLFEDSPNVEALLAHALALAGDRRAATAILEKLEAESAKRYVSGVDIALIDCALGDSKNAMSWLERGYMRRDKGMNVLGAEPLFDGCRVDPHFQDLLYRMKL